MPEQKDALDKVVEKVVGSDKGEDPEGKVKQLEGQVAQKIRKYKTETPETELHIKDDGALYVERDCGDVTFGSDPDQLLHIFDGDDHTIKIDSNAGPHIKILISSDGEITIDAVYKWGEIK